MEIFTSRGMLPLSSLTYCEGTEETDDYKTTWEEWRAIDGEIVKRNVRVDMKRWPEMAGAVGGFDNG